jgi:hypothetical protein
VAPLSEQVNDSPVIVPALEMFEGKLSSFRPPQPAPKQDCKYGAIPLADQHISIWAPKHFFCLSRAEPVNQPHAQTLRALDAPNARGQVRAEQSNIGRFVGEPPDRG